MHRSRRVVVIALFGLSVGFMAPADSVSASPPPVPIQNSIGSAKMLPDRTIRLQLRAEAGAVIGDALFLVKPDDPRYQEVLAHVGGLAPGEEKPVPPWPERK